MGSLARPLLGLSRVAPEACTAGAPNTIFSDDGIECHHDSEDDGAKTLSRMPLDNEHCCEQCQNSHMRQWNGCQILSILAPTSDGGYLRRLRMLFPFSFILRYTLRLFFCTTPSPSMYMRYYCFLELSRIANHLPRLVERWKTEMLPKPESEIVMVDMGGLRLVCHKS
jgi:hypothetical protein